MMEKIEWYQEILKLDPDSRAFFPLAKLLRESQQPEKAVEVLRAGLQHSAVYLEARLLLVQILHEQSRTEECAGELSAITELLEAYPAFWEAWADTVSGKNRDLALATRLMAATVRHPENSLTQILESGLALLQDVRRRLSPSTSAPEPVTASAQEALAASAPKRAVAAPAPQPDVAEAPQPTAFSEKSEEDDLLVDPAGYPQEQEPSTFPDTEAEPDTLDEPLSDLEAGPLDAEVARFSEVWPTPWSEKDAETLDPEKENALAEPLPGLTNELSEEPTLRTRSMADVLAAQGDIAGALDIYQELEAAAPTPEEARELHDSVVALASRVAGTEREPGDETDSEVPPYGDMGSQNRLMSLLESLADRLEARARV